MLQVLIANRLRFFVRLCVIVAIGKSQATLPQVGHLLVSVTQVGTGAEAEQDSVPCHFSGEFGDPRLGLQPVNALQRITQRRDAEGFARARRIADRGDDADERADS
jgi:hypothetical protein